jgi:anti-sigma-K factor RskA
MARAVRRRRRKRGLATRIVGVAAAVAVAFALAFTVGSRAGDEGTIVALTSSTPGVHAQAVLQKADEGTRVKLRVDGLDDGDWYWLWVTGADGRRVGAGTFVATTDRQDLTMTAALSASRTRRVWVTDADDRVVLDGLVKAT